MSSIILRRFALTAVCGLLLAGCGGHGSPTGPTPTGITLNPSSATIVPGGTVGFQASAPLNTCSATAGTVVINGGVNVVYTAPMTPGAFTVSCSGSAGTTNASVDVKTPDQMESYTNTETMYVSGKSGNWGPGPFGSWPIKPGAFTIVPVSFKPGRDVKYPPDGTTVGWQVNFTVASDTPNPLGDGYKLYWEFVDAQGNMVAPFGGAGTPLMPGQSQTFRGDLGIFIAGQTGGKTITNIRVRVDGVTLRDFKTTTIALVQWNLHP